MDCRSARHLLNFARPRLPELDRPDQLELDGHLAVCPDCDTLARAEHQLDDHLGEAIRDVPIPQGLQGRLLERLRQERDSWYRKQLGRGLRVVAAAAAVLLVTWFGLSAWREHHLPRPTVEEVARAADPVSPLDKDDVERWFKAKGIRTVAPGEFAYQYLSGYGLAELLGKQVPCLTFEVHDDKQPRATARVFILSKEQFDLSALQEIAKPYSTRSKVEIRKPTPQYAYVIVYSGDLNELLISKSERPSK